TQKNWAIRELGEKLDIAHNTADHLTWQIAELHSSSDLLWQENAMLRQTNFELLQTNASLTDSQQIQCPVCWERAPEATFLCEDGRVCGHVTCNSCAEHLSQCHTCRRKVSGVVRLFLPANE
ncbi:hypothetical protein AAVH_34391, partial [Aphelenchoides avenae]